MSLSKIVERMIGPDRGRFKLSEIDILTPYVSASFFRELFALKPAKVRLTTDIACPQRDLDAIADIAPRKLAQIRVGQCAGIVHAKLFLFHWQNKETLRVRHYLVWGSSNATDGGFGRNAECISIIPLSRFDALDKRRLLNYFAALHRDDKVSGEVISAGGLTLMLPGFSLSGENCDFLTWLQRGRLCNPFPPDSTFRRLKVQLLAPIDPQDTLTEKFRVHRLRLNQQTAITYDFLRSGDPAPESTDDVEDADDEDDPAISTWRSKYFTHTIYGYWTSADCYNALSRKFVKADHERREEEISRIACATRADKEQWTDAFLQILVGLASEIEGAERFLKFSGKRLDCGGYRTLFGRQMDRQVARANDQWFRNSYVSGFSFSELPAMRETSSIWQEFLESVGDSLLCEVNKKGGRQLLARTLRSKKILAPDSDGEQVIEAIEGQWTAHGRAIRGFFAPPLKP